MKSRFKITALATALALMFSTSSQAGPGSIQNTDYMGNPYTVPTYYANSPTNLRKFVDTLPGLTEANKNNLGQYIPVAQADTAAFANSDYYEIGIVEYTERMHSDLQKATTLRGYVQLSTVAVPGKSIPLTYPGGKPILNSAGVQYHAVDNPHYLGPLIITQMGHAVRILYRNLLPTGVFDPITNTRNGDLFLPVDGAILGAETPYTQNRAEIHLHGNDAPWISDGTPHQWITPKGENTLYPYGASHANVPDMVDPGSGAATLYYPNNLSARLMFYHDHTFGLTRLNVYAGEAAGYLIQDPVEADLVARGVIPADQIPLVIQDKTFVPNDIAIQDAKWDTVKWGQPGDLWFPHVYETNQDPNSIDGTNPAGRWDWGPWFWPVFPSAFALPELSATPEAYQDTAMVNGTAYPTVTVQPKPYRFRILNASNDRFMNLSLFKADPAVTTADGRVNTEVKMVPAIPGLPAGWPTDGRDGGVPDPTTAGPSWIQFGTEGGFLPQVAVIAPTPNGYEYNRRSVTVLNVQGHGLFMGPAERADVVVDFSSYPAGTTFILYNDSPAPVPAFDPRIDYYTGNPDQTGQGSAPSTLAGYGPNIRTIMQIVVGTDAPAAAFNLAKLQAELPVAYAKVQPKPVVAELAYNAAFGPAVTANQYARIFTGSSSQPTWTFKDADGVSHTMTPQNKAIQELFDPLYGRMNATLGVELPFTSALNQTTIPLSYIDPVTESIADGETQLWKITHNGVDSHPVHFHLVNVQIINRMGWDGTVKAPDANEVGWKDTVRMNPLEDIMIAVRAKKPVTPGWSVPFSSRLEDPTQQVGGQLGFTQVDPITGNPLVVGNKVANYMWEYVWHCHILGHEENDFMRPFVFNPKEVLPLAPTLTSATPAGANSAIVNWTDNSNNEYKFNINRQTGATWTNVGSALANAGSVTPGTFTDSGLTPKTKYSYKVDAVGALGSVSSNVLSVTTPGLAQTITFPAIAARTLNSGAFAISATASSGLPVSITSGSTGICTVTGATVNLVAVGNCVLLANQAGNAAYDPAPTATQTFAVLANPIVTSLPPPPPTVVLNAGTNFVATLTGANQITFTWTDNSTGETAYKINRKIGNATATQPVTTGAFNGPATATLTQTLTRAIYTFSTTVYNGATAGPVSNTSVINLTVRPATPTGFTATAGTKSVVLNWTGANNVTGYTVQTRNVTTRAVRGRVRTTYGQWTNVSTTIAPNATTYTVGGLVTGTTHQYRISARNPAGTSATVATGNIVVK